MYKKDIRGWRVMTHLESLFHDYCTNRTCVDCKYFEDKRVVNGKSCNEAYEEDYNKRYAKKRGGRQ